MPETIGFIGLGLMGKPMALNLLKAGYPLVVNSRSQGPVEELVAAGAARADTPEQMARQVTRLITMVPDSPDVELVLDGPHGAFRGAAARHHRHRHEQHRTRPPPAAWRRAPAPMAAVMLDAPVSGGDIGAKSGTLSIMVGGDAQAFAAVRPILDVLGNPERVVHVGVEGAGQLCKLCNQMVIGGTLVAVAEALALARKAGVDAGKVREALLGGFAQSRVLEVHGARALAGTYVPGFKTLALRQGPQQRREHPGRAFAAGARDRRGAAVAARHHGRGPWRRRQFGDGADRLRHGRAPLTSSTPMAISPLPLAPPRSLLWRVPLLAAAYVALARVGFILDIEPGFASSIWPAAGVGTAALLVWGLRLWPGVLLGSFYFNWWLSALLDSDDPGNWVVRAAVAAAIGGGVTLQALTSAGLGRPLLASGGVLRSVHQAVPFLIVTGPASCLLSATTGVGGTLGRRRPARRRSVRQLVHVVDGRFDRRPAARSADAAGASRGETAALAAGRAGGLPARRRRGVDHAWPIKPPRSRVARTCRGRWPRCRTSCAS